MFICTHRVSVCRRWSNTYPCWGHLFPLLLCFPLVVSTSLFHWMFPLHVWSGIFYLVCFNFRVLPCIFHLVVLPCLFLLACFSLCVPPPCFSDITNICLFHKLSFLISYLSAVEFIKLVKMKSFTFAACQNINGPDMKFIEKSGICEMYWKINIFFYIVLLTLKYIIPPNKKSHAFSYSQAFWSLIKKQLRFLLGIVMIRML